MKLANINTIVVTSVDGVSIIDILAQSRRHTVPNGVGTFRKVGLLPSRTTFSLLFPPPLFSLTFLPPYLRSSP